MSEAEFVEGWGRMARPGREQKPDAFDEATRDAVLSRGLGRSYGDSSLPPPSEPKVVSSVRWDRILAFDDATGQLDAESGLSLIDLNRLLLPRGWFTPVTPGTQFVTLGGMVAADVHGKNHHVDGTIGAHVQRLRLRVADGRVIDCSPSTEPELFWATVGGMGLTGHILEVSLRLQRVPSQWIFMESERVADIDEYIDKLKEAASSWPYTMGWIDCLSRGASLGRGIIMRGRWATASEAPAKPPSSPLTPTMPFEMPSWLLNRWSVRAFNELLYRVHPSQMRQRIMGYQPFFYPLDSIRHWNRLYGRRGFTQHQCVLPESGGRGAARRFLERLTDLGGASMLCVIKDCGAEGKGMLSFPRPGISIPLDIPVSASTQSLVDALDERVLAEGGRIYLAKDGFTRPETFAKMEAARLPRFLAVRDRWDPTHRFRSAQSVRLLGDRP